MADAQAKACPVCGISPFVFKDDHFGRGWLVECRSDDCALSGPQRSTESEAIAAWNKLASVEPVEGDFGEPLRFSVEFIGDGPDERPFGVITDANETFIAESAAGASEEVLGHMDRMVACHNALAGLDPEALGEFITEARQLRWVCGDGSQAVMPGTDNLKGFDRALAKLRREVTP